MWRFIIRMSVITPSILKRESYVGYSILYYTANTLIN